MTSYQLSQNHNFQSVLWAIGGAIWTGCNAIGNAYRAIVAMLPSLLLALASVVKALVLAGSVALVVAVVAMIPPVFWLGLLIVGAFGWVTFPRAKVVRK